MAGGETVNVPLDIPPELVRYLQGSLDSGAMIIRVHRNDVQLLLWQASGDWMIYPTKEGAPQ